ncbi:MAG: acetylglucosamine transferase, partial [Burkholderiaceae bacterium]|nr:acetylglucosamine transferase [Burkholderiaceae bacterium]
LVDKAKAAAPHEQPGASASHITGRPWIAVTELAELILNAVPKDPVALACLAEVEHAHGHTEFAVTYLHYATKSLGRGH